MIKKKIKLKDIAKELEVSISTVSKALKNSEEISRDTKEKIQAFARLYNYKPNNIAVSLKNKRTKKYRSDNSRYCTSLFYYRY